MKNYEERAIKFAKFLDNLFADCKYLDDFEAVIMQYNRHRKRKLKYSHGVSRIAIMRSDYVIKFDFTPIGYWRNGRAGNCASEEEVYQMAVRFGMEYLLAKTTLVNVGFHTVAIMPRIKDVGNDNKDWTNFCTREEEDWLMWNINDLHSGNVGYRNRKVCVIDYAWGC